MKKLFFLLMLTVIGIANAKAQKSTINTLFPNKATEIAAQKAKEDVQVKKQDVSTPTKQRLFQNYRESGTQRSALSVAKSKAVTNTKMASESDVKVEKTEPKTEVKQPPMQQESTTKQ